MRSLAAASILATGVRNGQRGECFRLAVCCSIEVHRRHLTTFAAMLSITYSKGEVDKLMKSQRTKLVNAYYWLYGNAVYIVFLLLIVTSCGLPGLDTSVQKNPDPMPSPIVASFTPARDMQFCGDTKPLVPDSLFKSAAALVADMLDSSINVNEGRIEVFISYIVGSDSYLKDAFSWSVDSIPNDPAEPLLTPTPNATKVKGSSYDVANAQSTAQAVNDAISSSYYKQLNANHALLASARATMKRYSSRLRSLSNINSPALEDVGGCLLSASSRMAGLKGRKTIILSSPLAEDARAMPFIDLSGISIEVINWQCVFSSASACITSRNAWDARLRSFGAVVSIRDPQESQVVKPTF